MGENTSKRPKGRSCQDAKTLGPTPILQRFPSPVEPACPQERAPAPRENTGELKSPRRRVKPHKWRKMGSGMLRSRRLECRILRYIRVGQSGGWRATTIPELSNAVGSSDWEEVIDAIKRLHRNGVVGLHKWKEPDGFMAYVDPGQDAEFFGGGGLELRITPEGRTYFESLEEQERLEKTGLYGLFPSQRELTKMAALVPTQEQLRRMTELAGMTREIERAFAKTAEVRALFCRNFEVDFASALRNASRQFDTAALMKPILDSYKGISMRLADAFTEHARLWQASIPLRELQHGLAIPAAYAKAIEDINLNLPTLALERWPTDVLAGRLGLIEQALKNVSAFEGLRDNIASRALEATWPTLKLEGLTIAGQFVLDYGRFVRRLPPPIPTDEEETLAPEFRRRDEEVGAKLEEALELLDPRLLQLRRTAWTNVGKGGPAAFRAAMLALREMFTDVLQKLAPTEEVKQTDLWRNREDQSIAKPTRRMRIEFIMGEAAAELDTLVQFDESIQESNKFAHTFADDVEVVRVYLSQLENCTYLLLVYARSKRGEV